MKALSSHRDLVSALLTTALLSAVAGCGSAENVPEVRSELGKAEEELALIAWPGLVENGSTDASVNWVTSFSQRTGCTVTVKAATSVEQMRQLIDTGAYDGVSAPGILSRGLITDDAVEPINPTLIKNFSGIVSGLKDQPWNSSSGQPYGVPQGRSASPLTWLPNVVKPAPSSLAALFDPASPQRGKIMVEDTASSLAAVALALRSARPELRIENPYALNREQFTAVVEQARIAQPAVNLYWTDYTQQVRALEEGSSVIGLAGQSVVSLVETRGTKLQTTVPGNGVLGNSDTWMLLRGARHPSCMYRWMDHVLDPVVNAQISEYYGQAPSVTAACGKTVDKSFCQTFHATDEGYYQNVWMATTPGKSCVAGKGGSGKDKACVGYADWQRAWQQLRQV
ncbi:MAG: extracellular solute-binding protein [Mycobacteriales bacterium]